MPFRKNRCSGRAATNFWILFPHVVGRPAISRPARRLGQRAGYIENLQETGEGLCPGIFFFFFYFFSLFSLYFRRGKDAYWSKGKEKRKRDKLYRLRNSGNRPWRQSGERSRPVYFFFSVFPLVTSRVGRMRIEAKKRINYICFQTREIVPCDGLASVWAQVIYFLFSS